ncbi:hypothetical protein D3C80_1969900 [compost metagenome]
MNAKVNAGHFFDSINHSNSTPSRRQVNFLALIVNLLAAKHLLSDMSNHILSQLHDVFVVGISFVQLNHRKLRVVAC